MTSIKIINGPQKGRVFELAQGIATVGRDQTNSIQVLDFEISRRHAEFHFRGDEYWVFDLDSSNGTFLNGDQIASNRLKENDQIRIGQTLLEFGNHQQIDKDDTIQNLSINTVAEMDSDAINENVSNWIARAKSNIQVMYQTALATSNHQDPDKLIERLLELVFTWSSACRASVLLKDEESEAFIPKAFRHSNLNKIDNYPFEINKSVVAYVVLHQEGVLSQNLAGDSRFEVVANSKSGDEIVEVICVPIRGRAGVRGLIYVEHTLVDGEHETFDEEQFKLLIAIGHQAAAAIENVDYYQSLLDSERVAAVGEVMGSLSHHIKNILQSINGGTHLIEDGLKKRNYDLVQNGWQIVQRNQDLMSNLVMDMLSYSKKTELNLKTIDLNELVRDCVKSIERRASYYGVTVEFTEGNIDNVLLDRELLTRAMNNLLTASIRSCRDNSGGLVSIRLRKTTDGFAEIVVSDNGVQMSKDEALALFDPLAINEFSYRTGIHMAVSKKIVEEHRGTIAASKNPEQGTVFTVRLPLTMVDEQIVQHNAETTVVSDASILES